MRLFFFNDTAAPELYSLSLHDALPISAAVAGAGRPARQHRVRRGAAQLDRGAGPAQAAILLRGARHRVRARRLHALSAAAVVAPGAVGKNLLPAPGPHRPATAAPVAAGRAYPG